ncbi:MAG: mechanosensitive ion channel family protein [Pseudomonadota bacterium]
MTTLIRLPLALLTALTFLIAAPAAAQMPGMALGGSGGEAAAEEAPALDSPEAAAAMVARMSDEEVRGILMERLLADIPAEAQAAQGQAVSPLTVLEMGLTGVVTSAVDATLKLPGALVSQAQAFSTFAADRGFMGVLTFFALLAVGIGAGLAAEQVVERLATGWRARIKAAAQAGGGLREVLIVLAQRLALDAGKLLIFYFVARFVLLRIVTPDDVVIMSPIAIYLVLVPRIVSAISRFILAPFAPPLRMVNASDATALALHRNVFGIAILMGAAYALITFNGQMGIPPGETRIGFWFNLSAFAWLGWMAWNHRDGLRDMMRGFDEVTPAEEWVARAYPKFALIAVAACWALSEALIANGLVSMILEAEHLQTLAILLMAPALDTLVRGIVKHAAPAMIGEGEVAETAYQAALRSWIRMGRVIALALVIMAISAIWDVSFFELLLGSANPLIAGLARFSSVLIVGYIAWEASRLWFNSRLAKEQTEGEGPDEEAEMGGAGASRLSTVLPLLSWFVQSAIVIMTILIGLSNLGVDVTPLLAGAGIVGLAIGFGAQKLVSDVVSGIFFLVDDAFRKGEFIDIGGTVGTVEKISIRSLQLRHHLGAVHTIPYGEIPQITNYSRDWVIMKLKFTVPFDTNLKLVKDLFKQIGKDMRAIPELKDDFLEPFKSQGVLEVNDVGIVMRGKFKAKPGKQFVLRKEIYNRVQRAFDANGIQFARKEVRVKVDSDADLTDADKAQIAAAANEATEAEKV